MPKCYNFTLGGGALGTPKVLTLFMDLTDIFFRKTLHCQSLTNIPIFLDIFAEVALDVDATHFATWVKCLVCTLVSCSAIHNVLQKLYFLQILAIVCDNETKV